MNIPHRRLEWVRRDAARAARLGAGGGGDNPTNALWRAIPTFHAKGRLASHDQLESKLAKFATTPNAYHELLDSYIASFEAQGNVARMVWQPVRLDLGHGVSLGGRIDRLDDRSDGGHAAWLFAMRPAPRRWRRRLAMPLLQLEVARALGVSTDQVSVGFCWFLAGEYSEHSYAEREVLQALNEARRLATDIARRLS